MGPSTLGVTRRLSILINNNFLFILFLHEQIVSTMDTIFAAVGGGVTTDGLLLKCVLSEKAILLLFVLLVPLVIFLILNILPLQ